MVFPSDKIHQRKYAKNRKMSLFILKIADDGSKNTKNSGRYFWMSPIKILLQGMCAMGKLSTGICGTNFD